MSYLRELQFMKRIRIEKKVTSYFQVTLFLIFKIDFKNWELQILIRLNLKRKKVSIRKQRSQENLFNWQNNYPKIEYD